MENNIKDLVREVLKKGYLMSLATHDTGGVWVADVIYIFDEDFNIYWMSKPNVRHSEAIMKNPKVAGTITANMKGEDNLGLQFEGNAQKVNGFRDDLAKMHYLKRGKDEPLEKEDVLNGRSWYMLKPSKIELINEKLFGFNKQKIEL